MPASRLADRRGTTAVSARVLSRQPEAQRVKRSRAFATATKTYDVLPSNANSALVGTPLVLQILVAGADGLTAIDDVRLDFTPLAVPAPPALALTALGLLVLCRRVRRPRLS